MPIGWYVLHIKANHERVASTFLEAAEIEKFTPHYLVKSRRRDRPGALVQKPLFAGYVFVRLDLKSEARIRALQSPGAVNLVGFGSSPPSRIPDEVIETLKILVQDGAAVKPHPYLDAGRRARVVDGPFAGAVGILDRQGRHNRLVVTLELLGRSVAVSVLEEDVELIH